METASKIRPLINAIRNRTFAPRIIETPTEKLDRHFEGLNLKSLPEYQTAIEALKKYSSAAAEHFERVYNSSLEE